MSMENLLEIFIGNPNIVLSSNQMKLRGRIAVIAWATCVKIQTISLCNYLRWKLDKTNVSTNWFLVSEYNVP